MQLPADAPPPRLCLVEKNSPSQEYGYNLHAERGKDHFIGTVDKGSPADRAGVRMGDRIFAVNGVSILGEPHRKVVDRIKQDPMRCELLVLSEEGTAWYREHGIAISPTLPNIIRGNEDRDRRPTTTSNNGKEASASPPPAAWYAPAQQQNKDPVFVAPPPPGETMPSKPRPVLCRLDKKLVTDEFGFNLHAEKGKGHFIGTVDKDGIGDRAGLRMSQRIVGVNGTLVYPNTPHTEVVALIKKSPLSTTLLVASEEVDKWYRSNDEPFSFDYADDGRAGSFSNGNGGRPATIVSTATVLLTGTAATHNIPIYDDSHFEYYHYEREHEEDQQSKGAEPVDEEEELRSRAPTQQDIVAAVFDQKPVDDVILEKEAELATEELGTVPTEEKGAEPALEEAEPAPHQQDDLLAAVFGALPPTETVIVTPPTPQATPLSSPMHERAIDVVHEEEEKDLVAEEQENGPGGKSGETDYDHSRETPVFTPEPPVRSALAYNGNGRVAGSNGGSIPQNGYQYTSSTTTTTSTPSSADIFALSANEARDRIRMNIKRRDQRAGEMSLDEKYRIVSNM